ncbi:hypothetical protein L218DRAFT_956728 [Marasmius fiardii PR-910]|nr:hypothetical protein L218DRAFT_956728 [Marasmius fiardii PR-910]
MQSFCILVLLLAYLGLCKGPESGQEGGEGENEHGGAGVLTTSTSNGNVPLPTAIGSPGLRFANPDNTTECKSTTFFWTGASSGSGTAADESTWSLLATNQGVPGHTSVMTSVVRILSSNVLAGAEHFTWLRVDVAAGWYIVQAQWPNQSIIASSSAFFVNTSADTSCIRDASQDSATGHPSYKPMGSHAHVSKTELIGIVVGSMAGLTILCMAFAFPQFWRHALVSPKTQRKHPYRKLF